MMHIMEHEPAPGKVFYAVLGRNARAFRGHWFATRADAEAYRDSLEAAKRKRALERAANRFLATH
jgi:hypothetical protein